MYICRYIYTYIHVRIYEFSSEPSFEKFSSEWWLHAGVIEEVAVDEGFRV